MEGNTSSKIMAIGTALESSALGAKSGVSSRFVTRVELEGARCVLPKFRYDFN